MSNKAPRGVRLVITLVGKRNAGKSSLINAISGQDVAIVSDQPGTTTDPVAKHYELLPLGPVTFYDTAGLDDSGEVGELRIKATNKVMMRTDLALVVIGEDGLTDYEMKLIDKVAELEIPYLVAFNKNDLCEPLESDMDYCRQRGIPFYKTSVLEAAPLINSRKPSSRWPRRR